MVQQIGSAIALAVVALNAASSMALPAGIDDMDLMERDLSYDDIEARDLSGSWSNDMVERAILPPKNSGSPHPAVDKNQNKPVEGGPKVSSSASTSVSASLGSAAASSTGSASTVANGSSATSAPSSSNTPNGGGGSQTSSGKATKTVTRTFTLRPTACGKKKNNNKRPPPPHHPPQNQKPKPKMYRRAVAPGGSPSSSVVKPTSSSSSSVDAGSSSVAAAPGSTGSIGSTSSSISGPSSQITAAPSSSSSNVPDGKFSTKTVTKTKTGKDKIATVHQVVLLQPTQCAEHHKANGHGNKHGNKHAKPNHKPGPGNGKGKGHKRRGRKNGKKEGEGVKKQGDVGRTTGLWDRTWRMIDALD